MVAYQLSVKAEEDIMHIYVEGVRNFAVEQAEHYYSGLEGVFQFLSDNPEAARERKEINPVVRIHPYRAHLVVYFFTEASTVFILRVRHSREDWQSNPL